MTSTHINDTLGFLASSSTLIIPTNFNTDTINSIDLLSNIGSSDVINIGEEQLLTLSSGSGGGDSSSGGSAESASTITGSQLDNATLVRILDNELFPAENKRGGAPDTFLRYDEMVTCM